MTDRRDEMERLSSEELIRRARDAQSASSPPPPTPEVEAPDAHDYAGPETPPPTSPPPEGRPVDDSQYEWSENPVLVDADDRTRSGGWRGIWSVARWVVGGFVLLSVFGQCFASGTSLDALDVGDCFEDPGDISEVSSVDTVDCAEPHGLELFSTVSMGSESRIFPGVDQLFAELEDECIARFDGYVGSDYWTSVYDIVMFTPLPDGWDDGDRTGMCALYEFNAALQPIQSSGSARNSDR
jgi:hypothetical protein